MGERITALDVLRGVAILGTLGTNVWIFTDPRGAAGFLDAPDGAAETALLALSNGKFLALLSILFGVGLAIQHASAVRRGARWPGWYLWRSALLAVEGALHYALVFEFDVLMFYAVVSVLVAFLVGRAARGWLIGAAALHLTVVGLLTALLVAAGGGAVGGLPTDTSSWLAQVRTRLELFAVFRAEALFVIPLSTALFLAGALLLRAGALEDSARGRRIQARLTGWGLGLGVPLTALMAVAGPSWFLVDRYVVAPLVAFGLLGAITALVHRTRGGHLRRGVTAVGRTALSCYVAQNVLASILCYRWGLGLADRLAPLGAWWTAGCWLLVSALLLAGATWWARRFARGPLEAAWHWAYLAPRRTRAER